MFIQICSCFQDLVTENFENKMETLNQDTDGISSVKRQSKYVIECNIYATCYTL